MVKYKKKNCLRSGTSKETNVKRRLYSSHFLNIDIILLYYKFIIIIILIYC